MLAILKAQRALGPWRYLIAVAASAAAVLLRVAAPGFLQGYGFITIFPIIMISALLLGWRVGAAALLTGTAGIWYFVLPVRNSFVVEYRNDAVALVVFFLFGAVILWGASAFERLLREVEAARAEAERQSARQAMLLAELRHRVGNMLQLVQALIAVRRRATQNEEARRVLDDAIDGVSLLARAQAALNDPDGAGMRALLDDIGRTVTSAAPHIRCAVAAPDDMPPRDLVVPLLLCANEMVMNAVEHAFPARAAGGIEVTLARTVDGWTLAVADDGAGLPPGFSAGAGPRQGLKIVAALARQMGATFGIENRPDGPGTLARLVVPAPPA